MWHWQIKYYHSLLKNTKLCTEKLRENQATQLEIDCFYFCLDTSLPDVAVHSPILKFNSRTLGWTRQMESLHRDWRKNSTSHVCDMFEDRKNLTIFSVMLNHQHQRELGKGQSQGQGQRFWVSLSARLAIPPLSSFTASPRQMQLILELSTALNNPTQLPSIPVDIQGLM